MVGVLASKLREGRWLDYGSLNALKLQRRFGVLYALVARKRLSTAMKMRIERVCSRLGMG